MPFVGAVTSNFTVVTPAASAFPYPAKANDLVLASASAGPVTVTLPLNPVTNTVVAVKKIDASTNAVSVAPSGTAKIDLDTTAILPIANATITVQYDGTNWQMLSTAQINTANASAGIPSGGLQGTVLTKNTGNSYDAIWSAPATGGGVGIGANWLLPNQVGYWYDARWTGGVSANTTFVATSLWTFYAPVVLPYAMQVDALGLACGSTPSGTAVPLAICSSNATTGRPATVLASTSISMASANTFFSGTFAAVTVPAGLNWLACGNQSVANQTFSGFTSVTARVLGPTTNSASASSTSTAAVSMIDTASSGLVVANPTLSLSTASAVPCVYFRCAA